MIKQKFIGTQLGGLIGVYSQSAIFISVVNTVMMAATFYNTTGGNAILKIFPWMNIWVFMVMLGIIIAIFMVLVYKYVTPSFVSFNSNQTWMHNNPMRQAIERLEAELADIKKTLAEIQEQQMKQQGPQDPPPQA